MSRRPLSLLYVNPCRLGEAVTMEMLAILRPLFVAASSHVIEEGKPSSEIFIIQSGSCIVT